VSRFDDWAWGKTGLPIGEMSRYDAERAAFDGGYRLAQEQAQRAVALSFWQGVCAERLQHHENEVRFFATFEREENQKVREWHRRRAEELRRWAREST